MKNILSIGEMLRQEAGYSAAGSATAVMRIEDEILANDSLTFLKHEDALASLAAAVGNLEQIDNMLIASSEAGNVGDEFKTEDAHAYADKLKLFLDDNDIDAELRADHNLDNLKVEDGFAGSEHVLRTEDAKALLGKLKDGIIKLIDSILNTIQNAGPKMAAYFSSNVSTAKKLVESLDGLTDTLVDKAELDVDRLVANFGGMIPYTKEAIEKAVEVANGSKTAKAFTEAGKLLAAEGTTLFDKVGAAIKPGVISDYPEAFDDAADKLAGDEKIVATIPVVLHGSEGSVIVVTDKSIKKGSVKVEKPADVYATAKIIGRSDLSKMAEYIGKIAKDQSKQVKEVTSSLNELSKLVRSAKDLNAADKSGLSALVSGLSNICYGGAKTTKSALVVIAMNAKLYEKASK